jgi:dienelactone hydrolase
VGLFRRKDQSRTLRTCFFLTLNADDTFFPDALKDKSEAEFASRKDKENFVEYEFKVYKGTAHGFALRPNLDLPEIKTAFEGALEQTVGWFKKTL